MSSILESVKKAAQQASQGQEPKVSLSDTRSLQTSSSSGTES